MIAGFNARPAASPKRSIHAPNIEELRSASRVGERFAVAAQCTRFAQAAQSCVKRCVELRLTLKTCDDISRFALQRSVGPANIGHQFIRRAPDITGGHRIGYLCEAKVRLYLRARRTLADRKSKCRRELMQNQRSAHAHKPAVEKLEVSSLNVHNPPSAAHWDRLNLGHIAPPDNPRQPRQLLRAALHNRHTLCAHWHSC